MPELLHATLAATIDPFLTYLIQEVGSQPATVSAYERDLRRFLCGALSGCAPADLTRLDIERHTAAMSAAGCSAVTVARHQAAIRRWCSWLVDQALIPHNIAKLVERPRRPQSLPRTLPADTIEKMIRAIDSDRFGVLALRERAVIELLYGAGLRAGELCRLRVQDVRADGRTLYVAGKGGRWRYAIYGRAAARALSDYLDLLRPALIARRPCAAVFVSRTGRPLETSAVWRIVTAVARAAGLHGVTPHTLRHCFATHLLENGANLRVVQELLGHACVTSTQVYTHVNTARLRAMHQAHHPLGRGRENS